MTEQLYLPLSPLCNPRDGLQRTADLKEKTLRNPDREEIFVQLFLGVIVSFSFLPVFPFPERLKALKGAEA